MLKVVKLSIVKSFSKGLVKIVYKAIGEVICRLNPIKQLNFIIRREI